MNLSKSLVAAGHVTRFTNLGTERSIEYCPFTAYPVEEMRGRVYTGEAWWLRCDNLDVIGQRVGNSKIFLIAGCI